MRMFGNFRGKFGRAGCGVGLALAVVKLTVTVFGLPRSSMARTAMVCAPLASIVVSRVYPVGVFNAAATSLPFSRYSTRRAALSGSVVVKVTSPEYAVPLCDAATAICGPAASAPPRISTSSNVTGPAVRAFRCNPTKPPAVIGVASVTSRAGWGVSAQVPSGVSQVPVSVREITARRVPPLAVSVNRSQTPLT